MISGKKIPGNLPSAGRSVPFSAKNLPDGSQVCGNLVYHQSSENTSSKSSSKPESTKDFTFWPEVKSREGWYFPLIKE